MRPATAIMYFNLRSFLNDTVALNLPFSKILNYKLSISRTFGSCKLATKHMSIALGFDPSILLLHSEGTEGYARMSHHLKPSKPLESPLFN